MKRLLFSLLGGAICSIICAVGRIILIPDITLPVLLSTAFGNRILIGFVIGISRLKINYLLHGALIGFLVTLSVSIGSTSIQGFIIYTSIGTIFGLFIEFFVTKICRVKQAA